MKSWWKWVSMIGIYSQWWGVLMILDPSITWICTILRLNSWMWSAIKQPTWHTLVGWKLVICIIKDTCRIRIGSWRGEASASGRKSKSPCACRILFWSVLPNAGLLWVHLHMAIFLLKIDIPSHSLWHVLAFNIFNIPLHLCKCFCRKPSWTI